MVATARLVFATNNAHKIEEAQAIVAGKLQLISLKEAGIEIDVDETGTTFHENAYLKAKAIYDVSGLPCVADDSGLCVEALGGAPGVYSARYAGEPVNHAANNHKLLNALALETNREACFKTVLCVVGLEGCGDRPLYFEGKVDGAIVGEGVGDEGFGYDPIFRPHGYPKTFAQMLASEKNALSHRARAFEGLMGFLASLDLGGMQTMVPALPVSDYDYDLPDARIAYEAMEPRDASRLLIYSGKQGGGSIQGTAFHKIGDQLLSGDVLVANDTKVIPARLHGTVVAGAKVEVFLLNPLDAGWTQWEVMVGNRRKFKEGDVVTVSGERGSLKIVWLDRDCNRIAMQFEGDFATMQDAIEVLGEVPLPPYIERAVTEGDKDRYQAIFAEHAGAVAAPTASLHFTKELQSRLLEGGVMFSYLTLHVGAGTFKPMTSDFANEHEMHAERFAVGLSLVDAMIMARGQGRRVVAIGTTSMRVLESLYFVGCRILQGCWEGKVYSGDGYDLGLRYIEGREISMDSALGALRERVVFEGGLLQGSTQIFIVEGFEFRVVAGLITNFHQPKSTLLMLISAFVGGDWRKIYGFALESGYRFLSYGDGSLLWR